MRYVVLGLWLSLTLGYASDNINEKDSRVTLRHRPTAESTDTVIEIRQLKAAQKELRADLNEYTALTKIEFEDLHKQISQLTTKVSYLSGNPPRMTRIGTADPILLGCICFGVCYGFYLRDFVMGPYYGLVMLFIIDALREKFLVYTTPTPIATRPASGSV